MMGGILLLWGLKMFNRTLSYSSYVLSYQVEKQQYNVSVLTRIISVNGTDLFMTMVNIGPRDSKAQPVADIVFFTNKTNLAEHYRLLGKVLNEVRKGDETGWVWNKAKNELSYLSRVVEREMGEYNVEGYAAATTMDIDACGACKVLFEVACAVGCGVGMATLCILAGLTTGVGGIACAAIAAAVCWAIGEYGCDSGAGYVCTQIGYC
ncbi:MAG: hypothetical protein XD40_2000 [Archaeoglobus fulgidus]|uniref:Uncharacterized protein n=2 Tax=Archaeoglobus fulgidus TaxID=2234 RepID=A0A117KLI3_ARCFL|nr:MAG: hypothetical protein XD40_2000 [Archaeoglobus fulgidus]